MSKDSASWAEEQFCASELGDKRRTNRLIKIASHLAENIGSSLPLSCGGEESLLEGAYRFVRNAKIKPYAIAEGAFKATVKRAQNSKVLLAIEDTTTLGFKHDVEDLGDIGGPKKSATQGFIAHNVLLVDVEKRQTLGLIEQRIWKRNTTEHGKSHNRRKRDYATKESYKWEDASRQIAERLGKKINQTISICDREADVYDYLFYKTKQQQRFIVRAAQNRQVLSKKESLLFDCIGSGKKLGTYEVQIQQKSGRKKRKAKLELRSGRVTIKPPKNANQKLPIEINFVIAQEIKAPKKEEPLCWIILTSEAVDDFEKARLVTKYYEMRWRVEEYHKAWKTGAGAERQRMQSSGNLERMLVILGIVAVRLLQLRETLSEGGIKSSAEKIACTNVLTREEWIVLWSFVNKNKKPPKKVENLKWAYEAIAKLGGWSNSKRTGIASWLTMWKGWFRLQERVEGYRIAKNV